MNFQGNFLPIGEIDIEPLKAVVVQLTDEDWAREDTRRKRFEVHQDTQFIGLVYDEDFRHMDATQRPALNVFAPVLHSLFAHIGEYYEKSPEIRAKLERQVEGYFVRVSLVKLVAGGEISEHRDMGFSLTHAHRVHVPIITNEDVLFTVGDETINMKEGEIFEINNRRLHSVVNQGEDGRVHLILDWVFPWEPCCCSDKTHPGVPCSPQACMQTYLSEIPCTCFPEDTKIVS